MFNAQLDGQIRFYEDRLREAAGYRLARLARQPDSIAPSPWRPTIINELSTGQAFCALPGLRQTVFCRAVA